MALLYDLLRPYWMADMVLSTLPPSLHTVGLLCLHHCAMYYCATVPLRHCTTKPLCHCTTVLLYHCTMVPPQHCTSYTTAPLHHGTTATLHLYTTVPLHLLHHCTTAPLCHCTTAPRYHRNTAPLHHCTSAHTAPLYYCTARLLVNRRVSGQSLPKVSELIVIREPWKYNRAFLTSSQKLFPLLQRCVRLISTRQGLCLYRISFQ